MTGNTGEALEARCEVEAQEVEGGADDQIWDLGDCLGSDKGNPMVGFRLKKTKLSVIYLPLSIKGTDRPSFHESQRCLDYAKRKAASD